MSSRSDSGLRVATATRKSAAKSPAQGWGCRPPGWGNPRPETHVPASRPPHCRAWRRELRLSALEPASRSGVPPLGPDSALHAPEDAPTPALAAPAAREHTWSSSLMSIKAGTLMVKARAQRTLHSQTTPTGKGSWHSWWRLTTVSGSPCSGPWGAESPGQAGPRGPIPPRAVAEAGDGRACPPEPPPYVASRCFLKMSLALVCIAAALTPHLAHLSLEILRLSDERKLLVIRTVVPFQPGLLFPLQVSQAALKAPATWSCFPYSPPRLTSSWQSRTAFGAYICC